MGWLDKYDDTIVAQGGETIPLSREIPEITVYGKKKYLQELDKQQQKYLADMAKYKQDSAQWVKANKAYQDSLVSYNRNRKAKRLFDLYTNYYDSDLKGIERIGNKVSIPSNYRQASDKDIIDAESGKMPVGGIGSEDPRQYVFSTNKENILLDRGITDILTTGYNIPVKPTIPIAPIKPTGTNVSYDDRYENLQMRPLWATMAKQDTTAKIGTLNSLDPLYEKGFTYGEAQKFPEEIKKQYKLDYPIYAEGGNVSYTPEYIEQLKRFENRPDNLAYHLDNKKIPTIGWGHRITEEELKRKAIKMGKEWVPYERFSGKEGRILADKLMEQDVSHHYARLERQVGKDTLSTLPPEVQDVLLDITYNRGSLGDSLEYVKKGDIAGLRDYLAETSKGLKGGAKTRMEWRANRIPLKTLPPVETPIEYNTKDQYVPEVLQSIAEQPSTQSIIPIQDNEGYRNQENYGKPVQITSNESRTPISMEGVPFPILAMSDTGELKIMMPGEEHTFEGGSVTELPMAQGGLSVSKSYPYRYPNILKYISPQSKLLNPLEGFNKTDSIAISPIFDKLDNYVEFRGKDLTPLEKKHLSGIVNILANPISRGNRKPEDWAYKSDGSKVHMNPKRQYNEISPEILTENIFKNMQEDISELSNEDIQKLANIDYSKFNDIPLYQQIKKIAEVKPKGVNYVDLFQYGKYIEQGPLRPMFKQAIRTAHKMGYEQGGMIPKAQEGMIYQRDDNGIKRTLNYLQGRWQDSPYPEILSNLYNNTLGIADYDKPYVGGTVPVTGVAKISKIPNFKSWKTGLLEGDIDLLKSIKKNPGLKNLEYHGIAKGTFDSQLKNLDNLIKNGVSKDRSFYTSTLNSFDRNLVRTDAPFLLGMDKGKVSKVFINTGGDKKVAASLKSQLQKEYKDVNFYTYDEAYKAIEKVPYKATPYEKEMLLRTKKYGKEEALRKKIQLDEYNSAIKNLKPGDLPPPPIEVNSILANGGNIIKSKQLRTFTKDSGWLSKYKEL